jgi:hypothetical protein
LVPCPAINRLKIEFSSSMGGWGVISRKAVPITLERVDEQGSNNPERRLGTHKFPSFRFVPVIMGRSRKSPSMTFLAGYSSIKEP